MQHTNQVGLLRENLHTTSSIIDTAVGTPLCWWLTRCHRVLPSQVSYGLIGWVGAGVKYSKPFVCICKHTATRMRVWRGCPAGRWLTHGECFLALGLAPQPVSLLTAVPATLSRLVSKCETLSCISSNLVNPPSSRHSNSFTNNA